MSNLYGIWVVPPDKIKQQLRKLITKFKDDFKTTYIEPHIPILPVLEAAEDYELVDIIDNTMKKLNKPKIKFEGLAADDNGIFVKIKPDHALQEIYNIMHMTFKDRIKNDTPFNPILRVVHGNLDQAKQKEVMEKLQKFRFFLRKFDWHQEFEADQIHYYHLEDTNNPESWQLMAVFDPKGKDTDKEQFPW